MIDVNKIKEFHSEQRNTNHYFLVHKMLKQFALEKPYVFFSVMGSSLQQEFLEDIGRVLCETSDKEVPGSFPAQNIKVITFRIIDYPAVLIMMPKPSHSNEAYMVGVVLKVPIQDFEEQPENPGIKYFTLEKGFNFFGDDDIAFVCEWNGEKHINYGITRDISPEAFVEKIKGLI